MWSALLRVFLLKPGRSHREGGTGFQDTCEIAELERDTLRYVRSRETFLLFSNQYKTHWSETLLLIVDDHAVVDAAPGRPCDGPNAAEPVDLLDAL